MIFKTINSFQWKIIKALIYLCLLLTLSTACDIDPSVFLTPPNQPKATVPSPNTSALIPEVEVSFLVEIPENSPPDESVYINILDEVTGLAFHKKSYPMQIVDSRHYSLTLRFAIGSVVKYRYSRKGQKVISQEHSSDGLPVRYRLFYVEDPGSIEDSVSRWTDTTFMGQSGRIKGYISDSVSGEPVPHILVTAGGAQTLTKSDGSFLIEGLPPGIHNLVAYALDGKYNTFQQGAKIDAQSTTPASISMKAAPIVNVTFKVTTPKDTIPAIPVRMAGNLYQLGNTYANLSGGASTIASRMPVLNALLENKYSLTLSLPVGADVRYIYTMGDGFWNTERTSFGDVILRQLIIPDHDVTLEDSVETWKMEEAANSAPITFDVTVPADTPSTDYVSVQFRPFYGWTEPIQMWQISQTRWVYVLNNPPQIVGDFHYRYCRNDQCNLADDINTMGSDSLGYPASISSSPQTMNDYIDNWAWFESSSTPYSLDQSGQTRNSNFLAGVELQNYYHPSWLPILPVTLDDIQDTNSNWVFLTPGWTYSRVNVPVLEPIGGSNPLWFDLKDSISHIQSRAIDIALFPFPNFPTTAIEWWEKAPKDFSWWLVWFEQYENFALHHADIATQNNVQALILGGSWLSPALPNGKLLDGTSSGVPADAEYRWGNLIQKIRKHYSGRIYWAINSIQAIENPPSFLSTIDGIYILWDTPFSIQNDASTEATQTEISRILDSYILPLKNRFNKPVVIGVSYPSIDNAGIVCLQNIETDCADLDSAAFMSSKFASEPLDLQEQASVYNAWLLSLNQRQWIDGFISRGYYPPAIVRDKSSSIHGKPAQEVLTYWFSQFQGINP